MPDALVLDFDGLILDTETPLFEAWCATYEHFGVEPIDAETWCRSIGLHDSDPNMLDPLAELMRQTDPPRGSEEIQVVRRSYRDDVLDTLPLRPGVLALLDAAAELGIPVAIASSSPIEWITRHLEPRGVLNSFSVISCAGGAVPGKPHPATYQLACRDLGVPPESAIAFEDSPNGVNAAKTAGLHCIAVPNPLIDPQTLGHADHVLDTLLDFDLHARARARARANPAADADATCSLCDADRARLRPRSAMAYAQPPSAPHLAKPANRSWTDWSHCAAVGANSIHGGPEMSWL